MCRRRHLYLIDLNTLDRCTHVAMMVPRTQILFTPRGVSSRVMGYENGFGVCLMLFSSSKSNIFMGMLMTYECDIYIIYDQFNYMLVSLKRDNTSNITLF